MKSYPAQSQKGFTIVELLVVIGVLGILAGISTNIINAAQQKRNANNALRRANLEKLVQGVEAFYGAEGKYPSSTSDTILPNYVGSWPNGKPANTIYSYATDTSTYFVSAVPLCDVTAYPVNPAPSGCTRIAKYRTANGANWGKIQDCDWQNDPNDSVCNNTTSY